LSNSSDNPGGRRSPLIMGLVLIVIGAVLLALNLGWGLPLALWDFWPVFLIIPGLVAIVTPSRHLTRSGGVWLLAWGVYCQISTIGFAGLGWFSAWPVFVIAYGLDIVVGKGLGCARQDTGQDQVSHEK
jgi:hypothetical protein